jgi:hypothetical protein
VLSPAVVYERRRPEETTLYQVVAFWKSRVLRRAASDDHAD